MRLVFLSLDLRFLRVGRRRETGLIRRLLLQGPKNYLQYLDDFLEVTSLVWCWSLALYMDLLGLVGDFPRELVLRRS